MVTCLLVGWLVGVGVGVGVVVVVVVAAFFQVVSETLHLMVATFPQGNISPIQGMVLSR